jgi:hypothetical protein
MVPEAVLSRVLAIVVDTGIERVLGSRAGTMRARQGITRVSMDNFRAEKRNV